MTDRSCGWLSGHGRSWNLVPNRDPFISQLALQRNFGRPGETDRAICVQRSSIRLLRSRLACGRPVLRASGRVPDPTFFPELASIERTREHEDCGFTAVALQGVDTIRVRVPSGLSGHKADVCQVSDRNRGESVGSTATPTLRLQGEDAPLAVREEAVVGLSGVREDATAAQPALRPVLGSAWNQGMSSLSSTRADSAGSEFVVSGVRA